MAPTSIALVSDASFANHCLSLLRQHHSILQHLHKNICQWGLIWGHDAGQDAGHLSASIPSLHRPDWISTTSGPEDLSDKEGVKARVGVMLIIFVVSLLASSFPSVSKRVKSLRIPKIVFFIGKHFGTGVILSTAFVHLLQDAFSSLQHPSVKVRWNLGNWTGLIILGSLLSIFFVEYISTSYVDRLHSYHSVPPSPEPSQPPSPSRGHDSESSSTVIASNTHTEEIIGCPLVVKTSAGDHGSVAPTEQTPLIQDPAVRLSETSNSRRSQSFSYGSRSQNRPSHSESCYFYGHHRHESRGRHGDHHNRGPRIAAPVIYTPDESGNKKQASLTDDDHESEAHISDDECEAGDESKHEEVKVGRRRQIVGILVLQLGIMIHSLVIGLTLAITSGSEFTSLVTAIAFHQLFEGLSLGIRIAGLPASKTERTCYGCFPVLKTTLMVLFAATTPIGILIGLLTFARSTDTAQMKFTQGLMCAISAGMLIYVACVEMLAGDFVMDTMLWRSPIWKQAVALASLLIGAAAMAVIGIWQ